MSKSPTIEFIETLAKKAGEILRSGYGQQHEINHKGAIDLVTEIDYLSEALILQELRTAFPEHQVVSEESGAQRGSDCCLWFIDPLDGTVNYAHNIPIFSVSIAYQEAGEMQLGVVFDPLRQECFSSERGKGARLNGAPIYVSQQTNLDQSLLVTGFSYDIRTREKNNLDNFARLALNSQGVRRLGSAALDLCYVAAGRFDAFWELSLSTWDIAAGSLIVEQAGGIVTNALGEADYLISPQSIIAANPYIHPQLQKMLDQDI
jgi:myo-inositol-1(or 4)-monophosphatase